jgi:DNA-binding CsgD family transcriptional regulator
MSIVTYPVQDRRGAGRSSASPPRPSRAITHALVIHQAEIVRLGVSTMLSSGSACEVASAASVYEAFHLASDVHPRETFLVVIRRVMDGMGPIVAGFPSVNERLDAATVDEGPVSLLTPREREMLYLIGQGLSNREIAESLVLSVKTVEAHRANLSRKLNVRSRAGLMRLALTGSLA